MKFRSLCLAACAAATLGAAAPAFAGGFPAVPTSYNFNPAWPTTPPVAGFTGFTGFAVFLPGNQVATVSANYNAFKSPAPAAITYDPATKLTEIKWTSTNPSDTIGLGPSGGGPYGPGNSPVPHFGFTGIIPGVTTGGEKLPPVKMEWFYGSNATKQTPTLGVKIKSTGTGPTKYVIEYVTATSGGLSTGSWFELPYQGSYQLNFIGTGGPMTISNAGFMLSPTEIPLDQLNQNDLPPPGMPGSTFQSDPNNPDGTMIPNGGIPEPATWAMMILGVAMVGAARRRRSAAALLAA
jgi:hypothetical protein